MKNLKSLRTAKHLSQQKLADLFSLAQQSIYKYENGLAEPDINTMEALADYFNTSVDYLIGHTDYPDKIEKREFCELSESESEVIEKYRGLTAEQRHILDLLIREFTKRYK